MVDSKHSGTVIGALFIIGIPGPEMDSETRSLLERIRPSGVCLFARNIRSAEQVRNLTDGIRSLLGNDTIVTLDQEGGRVDRLRRIVEPMPPASQLSTREAVTAQAALTGRALRLLGFNMNFAPVLDVAGDDRDCSANGLATRTFPGDAQDVSEAASLYLEALHTEGVEGCAKHFPGLGASRVDSHEELPEVDVTDDLLRERDLLPFRDAILSGTANAVMTAHARYRRSHPQEAGGTDTLPSSLDPSLVGGLLRTELGFEGLVITDDLEMGAVAKRFTIGEAAVLALEAGNDQVLICNEPGAIIEAFQAVSVAVDSGRITPARLEASRRRVYDFKSRLQSPLDFDEEALNAISVRIRELKSTLAQDKQ